MPNELQNRVREALREQAELEPFVPGYAGTTAKQAKRRLVRNSIGAGVLAAVVLFGAFGAVGSVLNAQGPKPLTSPSVPTPIGSASPPPGSGGHVLPVSPQLISGADAFVHDRDVWLMGQQDGTEQLHQLTADGDVRKILGWFPDHRSLLIARTAGRSTDLVRVYLAESTQAVLVHDFDGGFQASLSPDGSTVASCGSPGLSMLTLADGSERSLSTAACTEVAWSPDGAQMVIGRYFGGSKDAGVVGLWVARADVGGVRSLGRTGGFPHDFSWSPDGSSLALETNFVGINRGATGVYVVDVASGRWRMVAGEGRLGGALPDWLVVDPAWSADGRSIYVRSTQGISLIDVQTGAITLVAGYGG
jgi:hypothetical protein